MPHDARRERPGILCAHGAHHAASRGRSTRALGSSMALSSSVGFAAMALGILGLIGLTVGGLLRLCRPVAAVGGRVLIHLSVGGSLGIVAGLCVVAINVGLLHGRDDVGLVGDAVIAYFIGAGLAVPVFAIRELKSGTTRDAAA
jgi:hypothetical protein